MGLFICKSEFFIAAIKFIKTCLKTKEFDSGIKSETTIVYKWLSKCFPKLKLYRSNKTASGPVIFNNSSKLTDFK